jgi:hypothetical protein
MRSYLIVLVVKTTFLGNFKVNANKYNYLINNMLKYNILLFDYLNALFLLKIVSVSNN